MNKESSDFLKHLPCKSCGSKDNVAVYSKGPCKCLGCGVLYSQLEVLKLNEEYDDLYIYDNILSYNKDNTSNSKPKESIFDKIYYSPSDTDSNIIHSSNELLSISKLPCKGFNDRGISVTVAKFFEVKSKVDSISGNIIAHYYPYGIKEISGYKVRDIPKRFSIVGKVNSSTGLFGQSKFPPGGKRLVITEGELDTLTVAEAFLEHYRVIYPVVSLPSSTGMKTLINVRDWVRTFDEVILLFDKDEAGDKATREACKIIGLGKVKIGILTAKDPSEQYLTKGIKNLLISIWNATLWSPASIVSGEKLWEHFSKRKDIPCIPYPPCVQGLNNRIFGMRLGEIDLFVSGTGSGKSTLMREIQLHIQSTTEEPQGLISLEESPGDTVYIYLSMYAKRDIVSLSDKEQRKLFDEVFASGRIKLLDHHGSLDDGTLLDKIESLCILGCKYIALDHLTIAVSEVQGELNKATDRLMSGLARLAKRYEVWFGVISHLRKSIPSAKAFESGRMPSLDDIKGSGSIKQVAYQVVAFARDMTAEDEEESNITTIQVLKARIMKGQVGSAGKVSYSHETGRLSPYEISNFNII